MRVIGYASGSGETLWKAVELQREMERTVGECPFEIVGIFTSDSGAKCIETAKTLQIPYVVLDIKEYYKVLGKPLTDRQARRQYDIKAMELIEKFDADVVLLAGYVWAVTDVVLDRYVMINVHPADLSVMSDGRRLYAGKDGVGGALKAGEPFLRATAHLASKELDAGPILVISEEVPVDYGLHETYEARLKHYLRLVNEQSRLTGARALLETARGNFAADGEGKLYYKGKPAPKGLIIESWQQNKPLFQRNVEKLLYPGSVAVIGASGKPGLGRAVAENLFRDGFPGPVSVVNRRAEPVMGFKGYASVLDIEEDVDLAVITVPSGAVLEVAEECGKKGVKALICVTAGFSETGREGKERQEQLLDIVNRYNMRMTGPNCMGLIHAASGLNATMLANKIIKGHVALVTQSGSIGAAMLDFAENLNMGFSSIISVGNQADVTVLDLLPLLDRDETARVIVLYLETLPESADFYRVAAKIKKPVLLLKSGSTEAGAAAVSSHTGSLAGNDRIVNALIRKSGVVRVNTLEDCYMAAAALGQMPQVRGGSVAVLTNAGGPGSLIADGLSGAGFVLPNLPEAIEDKLRISLLPEASVNNPIDVVAAAPPEHYAVAAKEMLDSGFYDSMIICCVPPATVDTGKIAEALVPVVKSASLPVLTNFLGPTLGAKAKKVLCDNNIPTTQYPEQTAAILSGMRIAEAARLHKAVRPPAEAYIRAKELLAATERGDFMPVHDAYELLRCFGIETAGSAVVTDAEQTKSLKLRYPLAVKICHPGIIHKSDVGGVALGIKNGEELYASVKDMLERFPGADGVLVQEMVSGDGVEIIIGSSVDPQSGHAVMIGLGGIWVEVMDDVAFGCPPLSEAEAMGMIDSLRCRPLIGEYRGKRMGNAGELAKVARKLSDILIALPEIAELDINPLLYSAERDAYTAVDVRLRRG